MRGSWLLCVCMLAQSCRAPVASPREDLPAGIPEELLAELPSGETVRVRSVEIQTRDVFSKEQAADRSLFKFVNALHVPTHEAVIRREMWFGEGDRVSAEQINELERNLRQMGLFGEVLVVQQETDQPGEVDLLIQTRDRLSLNTGAGGFFVGGVGGFQANLGENNLFGTGNRISARINENSEGEVEASLSYTDIHFLDTQQRLRVSVGETEEGPEFSVGWSRPFKNLQDPISYGVSASYVEGETDYYENGETVAEVPNHRSALRMFWAEAQGPWEARRTYGLDLRWQDTQYFAANGPGAPSILVPGDQERLQVGPFVRHRWNDEFLELERIDALDAVEDLTLGFGTEVLLGGEWRREVGEESRVQPMALLGVHGAHQPLENTFVTWSGQGSVRAYAGDAQGWNLGAAVHAYTQVDRQTWAVSLAFDKAFEGQDLPVQLTLGEDNGLRGYPAREFAGTQRLRFNLEDRIATDMRFRSVHLGVVPFFDAAWIGEQGLGKPLTSVGLGLRFGSSELFGGGVIRMDFAVPLTEVDGQDFKPSFSVALGQVFSLFGNSSVLPGG